MTYSKGKTSPNPQSNLPIILVTGLLGSGKTTLLCHLIQQKPESQTWGIIINEFGELGIDGSVLQQPGLVIKEISGGCICCTAQRLLSQTLSEMTAQDLDLLLIEPTGLGHPAQMLDAIQHTQTSRPLKLIHNLCLVDASRFNETLWQKSAVLRDLVNLADSIILNKADLATPKSVQQQATLLSSLATTRPRIFISTQGHPKLDELTPQPRPPFVLLQAKQHLSQPGLVTEFQSELEGVLQSHQQNGEPFSLSWVFSSKVQFNRTALKSWLSSPPPGLLRIKGLIRTGKNWQLLNWVNGDLTFEDIAWRQDSRLEMLLEAPPSVRDIEKNLAQTLQTRDH